MEKILSLVIPTNGVLEWVSEVLESIYIQKVDEEKFEVIVVDNGNDKSFQEFMTTKMQEHSNLIYRRTNALLFSNQIEGMKMATGEFIKFLNHRSKLENGAVQYLIDYVKENRDSKPITYFLNAASKLVTEKKYYTFNEYVLNLKNYSSWSGGISCWKFDLEEIIGNIDSKDTLFPHIPFCFYYKEDRKYCINNTKLFTDVDENPSKKGKYNVYYAFGVEYVDIIRDLFTSGKIDKNVMHSVLKANEKFIARLYYEFKFLKKTTSYDLNDYKKYINYYYSINKIYIMQFSFIVSSIKRKIFKLK